MRKLYRYKEAAEKFYGGDEESLRHALLLGVVRARVELCDPAEWVWWVEGDTKEGLPEAGNTEEARWEPVRPLGTYQLTGWFYLDRSSASKIAHGRMLSDLLVSADEEEEYFLGLTFRAKSLVDLNDLWFEPSEYPDRAIGPEDEALDEMASNIHTLTDDPRVIARFQAAANAGSEGFGFEPMNTLIGEYHTLGQLAVAMSAMASVREEQRQERAKGGYAKAANAKPNPEKAQAIEFAREHPGLSALQVKTRAKLRASERTIRGWLAASC